jgi:hypothetical protein
MAYLLNQMHFFKTAPVDLRSDDLDFKPMTESEYRRSLRVAAIYYSGFVILVAMTFLVG